MIIPKNKKCVYCGKRKRYLINIFGVNDCFYKHKKIKSKKIIIYEYIHKYCQGVKK